MWLVVNPFVKPMPGLLATLESITFADDASTSSHFGELGLV